MSSNWVKIYASPSAIDVEILKSMLAEEEVETVILNKKDSSYLSFGYVELYCLKEFEEKALSIINSMKDE